MSYLPHKDSQRAELYFPAGTAGPAFLTLWLINNKFTVELAPRMARILLTLQEARRQDAHFEADDSAKGWRTRTRIAEEIEKRTDYPIDEATVTAYVSKLLRALSKVMSLFLVKHLQLIERRRGLGFRLATNLELAIIDGSQPDVSCRSDEHKDL